MVTDGTTCGTDDSGVPVFVGQLPMNEKTWISTQEGFLAEKNAIDFDSLVVGAVILPNPSEDIAAAGFAWPNGILYYARPSMIFSLLPAFSSQP